MKFTLKTLAVSMLLAASTVVHASGIPVVDAASIAQNQLNSLKELAEMAKQLTEAKNQVTQLKANVKALTGVKGFSDILELGGINEEIKTTLDDLLKGNTSSLTTKAKEYLNELPDCKEMKDSGLCENAALRGVAMIDFVEKLNTQVEDKLKKVTELSERIKSAQDMKSMAELQANISLEMNSIALIQQQTANFEKMQEAQQMIAARQRYEAYQKKRWNNILKESKVSHSSKDNEQGLSNLLN